MPPFQPPALPEPRGPLSRFVIDHLRRPVQALARAPEAADAPLGGDDFHLSLYVVYELSYRSFAGEQTERDLSPHGLVVHSGRWYLAAWDHMREDMRTFRIDRMRRLVIGELAAVAPPDGFDAVAHVSRGLFDPPPPFPVAWLR